MKLRHKANLLLLCGFLTCCTPGEENKLLLPVLGEKHLNGEDTVYHAVKGFTLTDQAARTVTEADVEDKIYVANFFFVSCQSICPEMSSNLRDVQAAFLSDPEVLILSHSVNPLHDTVEVLQRYAAVYGADAQKWHLLTGDKKMIYDLAKHSYLVNAVEDDGTPEGFLHSELFILVDKEGRLRGMYDGTDRVQVNKLIEDIRLLKKESRKVTA
jgi:protein SCO1